MSALHMLFFPHSFLIAANKSTENILTSVSQGIINIINITTKSCSSSELMNKKNDLEKVNFSMNINDF